MFLGEYQHTLDPKGRVILPAAFREELEEGMVMTVGLDNCVAVYPLGAWARAVESLRTVRPADRRERMFARLLTASAQREHLDRQGRVGVPARLREHANLRRDVAVIGADARIELWDARAWEFYRIDAMVDFAGADRPFDVEGL